MTGDDCHEPDLFWHLYNVWLSYQGFADHPSAWVGDHASFLYDEEVLVPPFDGDCC